MEMLWKLTVMYRYHMSHSLNSVKGAYIGDYYRAY